MRRTRTKISGAQQQQRSTITAKKHNVVLVPVPNSNYTTTNGRGNKRVAPWTSQTTFCWGKTKALRVEELTITST
jgi:hypothetical protein